MKVLAYLCAFALFIPSALAETTLLEFSATWCAPCRDMEPVVAGLEREGYRVERINGDPRSATSAEQAKIRQYRINSVPTFIAVRDGQEVGRVVGRVPASEIRRILGRPEVAHARAKGSEPPATASAAAAPPAKKPATVRAVAAANDLPLDELAKASRPNDRSLIDRSVRIVVDEPKGRSFGSGTVIHSADGETLIISCSHLFESGGRQAKAAIEFFGASDRVRLPGELVARDKDSDVSIIRVTSQQQFPAARVATKAFVPAVGQPARSVGCDNGKEPTVRQMRITAIDRYLGAPTIECSGQPVEGRSGGGLFNESGELIGVCSARDPAEQRGIYGGLAAIHSLLHRQGLAHLIESRPSGPAAVAAQKTARPPKLPLPSPAELGLHVAGDIAAPEGVENAEVVLVVRSIDNPNAPAKVLLLDRASPELLAMVEKEQAAQGTRSKTSMRLPIRPSDRPVASEPAAALDQAGWRAAKLATERPAGREHGAPQLEAARWQTNWPAGAPGHDGPVRR